MTVVNAFLNILFNKENLKIANEQLTISSNQLDQINISSRGRELNRALTYLMQKQR